MKTSRPAARAQTGETIDHVRDLDRRSFLIAVPALSAAGVAVATGYAGAAEPPNGPASAKTNQPLYRLTPHIEDYYAKSRW